MLLAKLSYGFGHKKKKKKKKREREKKKKKGILAFGKPKMRNAETAVRLTGDVAEGVFLSGLNSMGRRGGWGSVCEAGGGGGGGGQQ